MRNLFLLFLCLLSFNPAYAQQEVSEEPLTEADVAPEKKLSKQEIIAAERNREGLSPRRKLAYQKAQAREDKKREKIEEKEKNMSARQRRLQEEGKARIEDRENKRLELQ